LWRRRRRREEEEEEEDRGREGRGVRMVTMTSIAS
jgi:hypothetical protein